jgi:hypothetical protein
MLVRIRGKGSSPGFMAAVCCLTHTLVVIVILSLPCGAAHAAPAEGAAPSGEEQRAQNAGPGDAAAEQEIAPAAPPTLPLEGAPEAPAQEQPQEPPAAPEEEREETIADVLHGAISRRIISTAGWLDSFFGDERFESELNRSWVKFRYDSFLEEDSKWVQNPDVSLRLVLPQLRRKAHVIISGSRDQDEADELDLFADTSVQRIPLAEERRLTTALQYFIRRTLLDNLSVRFGAKLHSGAPVIFLGPRYRILFPFDPWALRATQEVLWESSKGFESKSRIDFERMLRREFFFRTSLDGVWTEGVHGYSYNLSFFLRHPVGPRQALEYQWVNNFVTRPMDRLEEVVLLVRYREQIWREWLFYEIAPQSRFPRDRSFTATPGILFRIEVVFGVFP